MCWQPISLKDPTSQELLEAVEQERSFSFNTSRNATIFHHPTLGDFELQHLPVGANDAELEERIIQHLAAAAAMGRARHIARREGHRNRSSAHGRPQFLVFSAHPNSAPAGSVSSSPIQREEGEPAPTATPSSPPTAAEDSSQSNVQLLSVQGDHGSASPSGSNAPSPNQHGNTLNNSLDQIAIIHLLSSFRSSPNQSSPNNQDRAGPSEFQSFSESLKSRFNAVSMRYKESISKSTRGWKERFFSRNNTMADLGSEVKREVNAGIATVSRMMERLETRDNGRTDTASVSNSPNSSVPESNNHQTSGSPVNNPVNDNNGQTSCAAGSGSN
ncbi:E3 ubiquitin-protein ligase RHF2A-like isoform X1 [Pistacia vera]|uniref:E3 ubiquitin-protein ligase RHF2A-like isoform X1 n=1 Tax=Pistacia vera TaxID=55513 RepID=UPI001262C1E2|nr:E3 ubiquitin-protein ligase RHF2A-like isoform X1 [Pistacia vera]